MLRLGRLVESIIQQLTQAKRQVSGRSGVQPVLAIESQLSAEKLRALVQSAEKRVLLLRLPDMQKKIVVEITEQQPQYTATFLQRGAAQAVAVGLGAGVESIAPGSAARGYMVRATAQGLPFADRSIDCVLARLATPAQGDINKALSECGRVLAAGGMTVFTDYHPYGNSQHKAKPHSAQSFSTLQDYYRAAREAGLKVIDVFEVLMDEELRKLFSENELAVYRQLKGSPLLICLLLYKPKTA